MAVRARGGRRRGRRGGELQSRINVTPLVDVMLVLLIVFMISAPYLAVGVPLELPKTDAKALPVEQDPITVSIDKEGLIYIQDEEVLMDELIGKLEVISTNGYEGRINLRGDAGVQYEDVVKVMARINKAGYDNIGLVTDPITK